MQPPSLSLPSLPVLSVLTEVERREKRRDTIALYTEDRRI